jgi:hypothetical protein
MIATHEVGAEAVASAERHYLKCRRPMLAVPRANDWSLVAVSDDEARWLLLLSPSSHVGQAYVAMARMYEWGEERLVRKLAQGAATATEGLPRSFTCDGKVVAVIDRDDNAVMARGPVALSLLSLVMRERRVGFNVTLAEDEGMAPTGGAPQA